MTVARDSFLESATFTTTSPHTFTGPTPAGTPRSVTVLIGHGTVSSDLISGAVTYGGVAMTRVPNGFAARVGGEPGASYVYHLGTGIPTGAQTVSISHTATSTVKWAICYVDTAAADTTVVVSAKLEGALTNPQSALDTDASSSLRRCIIYSGHDTVLNVVAISGMEARAAGTEHDFGTFVCMIGDQTTASTGSFTIGWTSTSDDVAMVSIAIQEVVTGATVAGRESSTETSVQSTHDVDIYGSTLANDYILIAAVVGSVATVTPPSGYTELVATSDALLGEYRIWYKLAVGGETTTTFTTSVAAVSAHLQWSIRNASIPEVSNANGTSAAPDPASLSPSGGSVQYLWLAIEGFFGAVTQTAGPTTYVQVRTEALAAVGGIGAGEVRSIASSENPGAFTLSGSGVWRTSTLAFPVAVAAVGGDLYPYVGGGYYPVEG